MSNYLYINTSDREARIGILEESGKFIDEDSWDAHRTLGATLDQKIKAILVAKNIELKELSGIVVYPGPGSFTGLRIGISYANSLGYGLNAPLFDGDQLGNFEVKKPLKVILPLYGAEPNITKPKSSL